MECPACHTSVSDNQKFCPTCGAVLPAASAPSDDPLLGTVIGSKYRIVNLLGEGGMGAVYLAEQQLGTKTRKVAVKTLHKELSRKPEIQARFQREVGTVSELEHPNTIQVYDFGTTEDGQLYIVMEYILGKNVADIIEKEGAMNPLRVENILRQVCGSLEEAHARGIVHRDLKPENIVLTERAGQKDFVKVLDFGIAKRSGEEDKNEQKLTQQGMVLGTPPYMSPEQFTGAPIDARSDIYSLGVMAYEMLTAQLPFKANTAWEWATQHMQAQPTPMEAQPNGAAVPANLRGAIMRAMAKAPADRFASVKDFSEAFSNANATPAPSYNAPNDQVMPKGKTQIGEPINLGMMGGMQMEPPAPVQRMQTQAGNVTPPAGNHAFPTPPIGINAVPPGPQYSSRPQKSNAGMFIGIGVVALFAIGAGAFAMVHSSSSSTASNPPLIPSATAVVAAATSASAADTTADNTTPPDPNFDPSLGGGGAVPSGGGGGHTPAKPKADAGTKPEPTPPGPGPKPTPTPPTPTPTPTPTPPANNAAQQLACAKLKLVSPGSPAYNQLKKTCEGH